MPVDMFNAFGPHDDAVRDASLSICFQATRRSFDSRSDASTLLTARFM